MTNTNYKKARLTRQVNKLNNSHTHTQTNEFELSSSNLRTTKKTHTNQLSISQIDEEKQNK